MDKQEKQESRRLPGFYIALCCCVIAVGIAGYFTERANNKGTASPGTEEQAASVQNEAEIPLEANIPNGADVPHEANIPDAADALRGAAADEAPAAANNEAVSANAEADNVSDSDDTIYAEPDEADGAPQEIHEQSSLPDTDEAAEAAALFTSPSFTLPASGDVLEGFSDTLVFNAALGDWRTHNGMDIAVDAGGSVCAAADGTVSKISSDAMGEYVVIEHDDGFSSKYRGLSSIEDIAEGDEVKAGDVIGIVAESRAESVADSHVHFELYKDGEPVDPSKYTG